MTRRKPTPRRESNLTPKQLRLLTYVRDFRRERGYAPTMQELADRFRVSKVTVFEHVEALQRKGYLERLPHKARSLRLSDDIDFPDERPTLVPLVGVIAAGRPIEAVEEKESLDLESVFTTPGEKYALRVQGDSMVDDQIRDGDFVIIEKRQTARNGETVVALLQDGSATLKRFYREPGGIRLQPANAQYKPLVVKDVTIQGVVVGLVRSL